MVFAPPLPEPVLPAERYMVVPRIGRERALQRVREEMCDGAFRPPDANVAASIEALFALFVPFWRVGIQRSDEAERLTQEYAGHLGVPVEQRSPTHATTAWMVCGRTAFPYEMKHPSALLPGDARPLTLHLGALVREDPD